MCAILDIAHTSRENWIEALKRDAFARKLMERLESDESDASDAVNIPDTQRKTTLADWCVEDGLLILMGPRDEQRLYVPESVRREIVLAHCQLAERISQNVIP